MIIKILIVDDDQILRELICDIISAQGYSPIPARNGEEAIQIFFGRMDIDLILLDVLMPKMNGWEVLKEIRSQSEVPVIMLTALGDESYEVKGLREGANDYIAKPFSHDILLSRVDVLLRKVKLERSSILTIDELVIDRLKFKVFVNNNEIILNHKEYTLLLYLSENRNIVLSRNKLLNEIWGFDYEGDIRNVDTHIKMLRAKLNQAASMIKTVRGIGYMMEVHNENHH